MGLNVDLQYMMKAPGKAKCPHCGKTDYTNFDDVDIESPSTNPAPGKWVLPGYCNKCEGEFTVEITIKAADWKVKK